MVVGRRRRGRLTTHEDDEQEDHTRRQGRGVGGEASPTGPLGHAQRGERVGAGQRDERPEERQPVDESEGVGSPSTMMAGKAPAAIRLSPDSASKHALAIVRASRLKRRTRAGPKVATAAPKT